nr:efflux RND transporter periplasmic adaptor subunit [Ancylobacter lacus]
MTRPSIRLARRWLAALLLLALVGGGWLAQARLAAPAAPGFITAEVRRGDIEQTVLATGTLKPSKLVAVGAQVSGRITSVPVVLGQKVAKGALLAEIDSVTQENELRTARAGLANVRAQLAEKQATLTLKQATLDRSERMLAKDAVSRADYDTAVADVAVTKAQIAALEAQIDEAQVSVATAQANLGYTRITAPIDGTVLAIVSQEGQTVNAAQSAPTIVILGRLDVMTIRAEISEADIVQVQPGQALYFTILGEPARRYDATLGFIEPAPESVRSDSSFSSSTTSSSSSSSSSSTSSEAVYYNGIFDVPNPDGRLRTYMTAEVHIVLGAARGVLTVPSSAVDTAADGRHTVRVLGTDGKASVRTVVIGLDDKAMAEVRDGLAEGERVVIGEASTTTAPAMGGPGGPPPGPMGF